MTSAPAISVDTKNVPKARGDTGDQIAGYIFMCNTSTKPDCFIYRVFGLPAARIGVVEKIKPNTKLFLFDFELKLLYGLYIADSSGKMAIEPYAFRGKFPAQVKFSIARDCLPLPEAAFKDAIRENYCGRFKFKQELSDEQVNKLISLFRPITIPSSPRSSAIIHNAMESLHPGYRGSSAPIASHGRYAAGSGISDAQLHPSLSRVQTVTTPPLRLFNNQVALAAEPSLSQPSYQHYDSGHAHQAYHPDDPGMYQRDTHLRYANMPLKSSSNVIPEVASANSYYRPNSMPQSNVSMQEFKAAAHSSFTASQWVAVASQAQIPGSETSSSTVLSSNVPHVSYTGSNSTVEAYRYQNQGCPSSFEEQTVIPDRGVHNVPAHSFEPTSTEPGVNNMPVHSIEPHQVSASSYYTPSQGDQAWHQTLSSSSGSGVENAYRYEGTNSMALAPQYQRQAYYGSNQASSNQSVSNGAVQAPETCPTYWTTAPHGHVSQQYPISLLTVPGASTDASTGYALPYSSGANTTY